MSPGNVDQIIMTDYKELGEQLERQEIEVHI